MSEGRGDMLDELDRVKEEIRRSLLTLEQVIADERLRLERTYGNRDD